MNKKVCAITNPPGHHFFGFHDLPAWNFSDNKLLCLEVGTINRPPLPGENAGVGYVSLGGDFRHVGETCAFNYPQGARMQWVGDSENFIVNNRFENQWGCDLYDSESDKLLERYPFSCHCLHADGQTTFSINYSRLHRLGVYGYAGLEDKTAGEAIPDNDGISVGDMKTGKSELLISISDVANYPEKMSHQPYGHHYLTHLLLNPSNTRLAFLHRYPLADGGLITRLMTIGVDGNDLRCLATGFLSHFDWKDDHSIFIFGRSNSKLDSLRFNPLLTLPLLSKVARLGKKIIKSFLKKGQVFNASFCLIPDRNDVEAQTVAAGLINSDGHPMFCPVNRDWIINDTYPDAAGIRTLMLFQFSTQKRWDLGFYKMLDEKPDLNNSAAFLTGIDEQILNSCGKENLVFTRSGLHCDLHPRWDRHGKKVAFDSIHEGSRQVYVIDVDNIIKSS